MSTNDRHADNQADDALRALDVEGFLHEVEKANLTAVVLLTVAPGADEVEVHQAGIAHEDAYSMIVACARGIIRQVRNDPAYSELAKELMDELTEEDETP
jgi:hypothetical protein